jgi:hypothetical protein
MLKSVHASRVKERACQPCFNGDVHIELNVRVKMKCLLARRRRPSPVGRERIVGRLLRLADVVTALGSERSASWMAKHLL